MPLTMASIGETNTIRKVGGNEETKRLLENLGFVAGAEITVVSAIGGNVIVNIKDSRVAVNQDLALHFLVELGMLPMGDTAINKHDKEKKGDIAMTLGDAAVGSTVVVTKITGDGAYKRRIMDMGITKGSELYIRKVAPLGDPVEITVRGYELSVRKNDAQCVEVK